jgi:hypothetical protein
VTIGYNCPQAPINAARDYYHTYLVWRSPKKEMLDLNRKHKWFSRILNDEIKIPDEIRDRFMVNPEGTRLLISFAAVVGWDETTKQNGLVFTVSGTSNTQGHIGIVHGGLSLTLREVLAKEYFKILFDGAEPAFDNFTIKYRKPLECYETYFIVGQHGKDAKGRKLDLMTYSRDGQVANEYTIYLADGSAV